MKTSIKLTLAALLTVTLLASTGCNTFKGIGQDFKDAGQAIKDVAN